MTCSIVPYGDKILVKRIESQDKTPGGIILPDNVKEKPMLGTVIKVGKGQRKENGEYISPDIKENDVVFFTKYSGSEIKDIDGSEYLILSEKDIIAKKN
jgi:chaperonin GroES